MTFPSDCPYNFTDRRFGMRSAARGIRRRRGLLSGRSTFAIAIRRLVSSSIVIACNLVAIKVPDANVKFPQEPPSQQGSVSDRASGNPAKVAQ